jgi:hypothetical protein
VSDGGICIWKAAYAQDKPCISSAGLKNGALT